MWQELLKMGVQIGGNALLPGAGSLGAGVLDATLPTDEQTTVNAEAQDKGEIDYTALATTGLGIGGGIIADLLKPKTQVMGRSFNKNQSWAQGG
jgi:hypothetical protein